jgi:hypothetical protein
MANIARAVCIASVVAVAVAGCATDEGPATVTVKEKVIVQKARPHKKRHHRRHRSAAPTAPAPPAFVHCDQNIQAKAGTTSCSFAENVFWTYWESNRAASLDVWSPAVQSSFATSCESDGAQVVCTTSDNAVVKFPEAALDNYSDAQAAAFASNHDLGPDQEQGLVDSPAGGGDCQGYDPCITPGDDVDCAGGSGNGPRYVDGPVTVSGADPYGLDTDGDGVGCEY